MTNYKSKYLEMKLKYINAKQKGGSDSEDEFEWYPSGGRDDDGEQMYVWRRRISPVLNNTQPQAARSSRSSRSSRSTRSSRSSRSPPVNTRTRRVFSEEVDWDPEEEAMADAWEKRQANLGKGKGPGGKGKGKGKGYIYPPAIDVTTEVSINITKELGSYLKKNNWEKKKELQNSLIVKFLWVDNNLTIVKVKKIDSDQAKFILNRMAKQIKLDPFKKINIPYWTRKYRDMLSQRGKYINDGNQNVSSLNTSSSEDFILITYNVEHYGYTSNSPNGRKVYDETIKYIAPGFSETFENYKLRIENVINNCLLESGSLIGFNEIGVLGYNLIKSNLLKDDWLVQPCIKELDDLYLNNEFLTKDEQLSFVNENNDELDIMDIYSNICCINKKVWNIIDSKCILYNPNYNRARSNTLMVNFLNKNTSDDTNENINILWLHTHLYYDNNSAEKKNQNEVLSKYIQKYQIEYPDYFIILSGDLYLYSTQLNNFLNETGLITLDPNIITYPGAPADKIFYDSKLLDFGKKCRINQKSLQNKLIERTKGSDHAMLISNFNFVCYT